MNEAAREGELNEAGLYRVGKFAGQTPLVTALYERSLDGGGDDDAGDVQAGRHITGFRLSAADFTLLRTKPYPALVEDDQGVCER